MGIEKLPSWPVTIPFITDSLPSDWEYLQLYTPNPKVVRGPHGLLSSDPQLGGTNLVFPGKMAGLRPYAIRRSSSKVFGTQAYVVSSKGLLRIAALQARRKKMRTLRLEHWSDVRLVADHWLPSLFPSDVSYVATVPTFVEDPCVSTIAPGENTWSHDTVRDIYLEALRFPGRFRHAD